jgi:acetylornithine deacetylase
MTDPVALLARLIAVDTHNPGGGGEPAICALLADELRARGGNVRLAEVPRSGESGAYVVATWGRPTLVLNAHVDTVPVNAGWTGNPFTARIDATRVMGLGAADTKGAVASILCALDEAEPRDLAVAFTGDEENTGTAMRALLDSGALAGVTRAVVCEPTSCRAGTRHRGILAIEVELRGKGGHSSKADEMPAPLADAARLAVAYSDWGKGQLEVGPLGFRGMCMNIAKLDGGVAFNVVPEAAKLCLSVRPPPGSDVDSVCTELFGIARAMVARGEIGHVTLSAPIANPSFHTRDVALFSPALGVDAPIDLAFWTEAALFAAAGIDSVVFGPGDIATAHAADELVPIADLHRARDVFATVIRNHGNV